MPTPNDKSATLREELTHLAGSDPTLARMLKTNQPLTLQTYLAMNYPDGVPDPMPAELLAEVPYPLLDQD